MTHWIPLFPLNTVLFPGQTLPLHIFEPRYRRMVEDCREKNEDFGVVLIREGSEVGSTAQPFEVGMTAHIQRVRHYPDGRMDLVCVGQNRFRILQTNVEDLLLVGQVVYWPWETGQSSQTDELHSQVYQELVSYLKLLSGLSNLEIRLTEVPKEPLNLAYAAAIALKLPNREKQALLNTSGADELLEKVRNLLHRENNALKITSAVPDLAEDIAESINLN